ncbi:hypothetical protein Ais01nite_52440 [Asanoa ishikariensis]|nr:hypothetical protein [Asanoa ishikariensis]GIF67209.1 hypothetical protein Ais01nite_52440 [Asanoa ishikariensis]
MSEQSTTPQPASQPSAGAPTPPPANNPLPPFTPPPASDFPAGGPQMIDPTKMSNKSIVIRKIAGAVIGLVLVLVVGYVWKVVTGDPEVASAGDCLIGQTAEDMKIVGCDDATAEWTVVGKVDSIRQKDFMAAGENDPTCDPWKTTTVSYWTGEKNGTGHVLCLEPIKK